MNGTDGHSGNTVLDDSMTLFILKPVELQIKNVQ